MKIRKIMALALAFCVLAVVCGCAKETKEKKNEAKTSVEPYVIMVNALNGIPVYDQQAEAAKKAAADYGVKLEITGPAVGTTPAGVDAVIKDYKTAMKDAISKKPDAIICEPFDPEIYECVTEAKQAGISVFCTSNGTENEDEFVACCGTDNVEYGRTAAKLIAEKTGGRANVLAVVSSNTVPTQAEQIESFKHYCEEKYPEVKVVATAEDGADASIAEEAIKAAFEEHPEIDTVMMLESVGGPVAVRVAKEMEMQINVLDVDTAAETVANIVSGDEWATLAQNYYKRGYESVRMAYEYITEDGVKEFRTFEDSSTVLITSENAADFEKILWENVRTKGKPW